MSSAGSSRTSARVQAGVTGRKLAAEVRAHGKRAFDRLDAGLAEYAVR